MVDGQAAKSIAGTPIHLAPLLFLLLDILNHLHRVLTARNTVRQLPAHLTSMTSPGFRTGLPGSEIGYSGSWSP